MAAAGVSPSSSPRLPSPPPFTEVQIGPKSPSVGESFGSDAGQLLGVSPGADDGPTRRIRPGTGASEMSAGPPLIPLSQLDSPFQLQEHLKALYNHYTRPEGSDMVVPIQREVARQLAEPPEGVERSLWLYELCRFLTMKVNNLIIAFFAENPPCSSQTCPEMRASEWQYLCAVHDPPKACCAIDYCCHTLDWATNILTSPKHFPSRLTLGSDSGGGPQAGLRHLTNIFRRLYRIFAHAWFQHREVFWQVEGHDGLYMFFKTVCDMYHLIPDDNYTVPPEAEGEEVHQPFPTQEPMDGRRLTILRKDGDPLLPSLESLEPASIINTGATTRRHKGSPSISSRPVSTINESSEDCEEPTQPAPLSEPTEAETPPTSTDEKEDKDSESPSMSALPEQTSTDETEAQVTVAEVLVDDEALPTKDEGESVAQDEETPEPTQSAAVMDVAATTAELEHPVSGAGAAVAADNEKEGEEEEEDPKPETQPESKTEAGDQPTKETKET